MGGQLDDLKQRLLGLMARGVEQDLSDDAFDELARQVFACQFEHNGVYRAFCERRGRTPDTVERSIDVPAVPTVGFKEVDLVTGPAGEPDAVFRTSGTTRGIERRGRHVVPDLALYDASMLPTFEAYVLPDRARLPFLCLVPEWSERPDSSLFYMISRLAERLGAEGSDWYVSETGGLDAARLRVDLEAATTAGRPVALLGTTLSFAHLLEAIAGRPLPLPDGSRLMDTGGAKGAERTVEPGRMAAAYREGLGIPETYQVNEYGMTELCSQFYDGRLRAGVLGGPAAGGKAGPPWMRTVAVRPDTLEPLDRGETGILRHHDLANLGSVAAVQTEDLGRVLDDGTVELAGRLAGARPRGCSIALDLLLQGRRRT